MNVVGQYKLKCLLDNHILENTLPRTLLLEGPKGCGKHLFTKYISDKLGKELIDITNKLDYDTIIEISLNPIKCVYEIDCDVISIRQQNVVLKFLEEPPENCVIILLCEDKRKLLQTVQNRCYCLSFDIYFDNELCQFMESGIDQDKKDLILQYAQTPGMVIQLCNEPLQDMIDLSIKIFNYISKANYSNVLTIPNKFYFCEEDKTEETLSFETFCYILESTSVSMYLNGLITYAIYLVTHTFYNDLFIPNINKKQLFEHYLIELKLLMEGE